MYIPQKHSGPTAPIETIYIVPPTLPISSYLTKSDFYNIIQQASNILSILKQYTDQHSSSFWSSINLRALSRPSFNKTMIFYQFNIKKNPSIKQASDLLSISEHYIAQHSTSLWSSINFRVIYSTFLHSTLEKPNSFLIRSIQNMKPYILHTTKDL